MGNNSTKKDSLFLSYSEYLEKIRYYGSLESTVQAQKQANEQLQKQNEALQQNIKEIQSQNDRKEKEKQLLRAEILKYESSPICKAVLNVNEQIMELERDIEVHLTTGSNPNRELQEEVNKLRKEIDEEKQKLKGPLSDLPGMKADELENLETALRNSLNSSRNDKIETLNEIQEKLNEIKERIPNSIQKIWATVEKDLIINRALFNDIKNDHVDVTYREIKNILVEQENILLRCKLNMSPVTVSGTSNDQKPFKTNNEDHRQYNLIFANIIEEYVDHISDYAKVREVLNYFTNVSTLEIKLTRLGRMAPDRRRIIKVTFPSKESVHSILRYKHKLKDSPYSKVRIFADKPPTNPSSAVNKTDY